MKQARFLHRKKVLGKNRHVSMNFWNQQPMMKRFVSYNVPRPISLFYRTIIHPLPSSTLSLATLQSDIIWSIQSIEQGLTKCIQVIGKDPANGSIIGTISYYVVACFYQHSFHQYALIVDDLYIEPTYRKQRWATYFISWIIHMMQKEKIPYVFFFHDLTQQQILCFPFQKIPLYTHAVQPIDFYHCSVKPFHIEQQPFNPTLYTSLTQSYWSFITIPVHVSTKTTCIYVYDSPEKKQCRMMIHGTYTAEQRIYMLHGVYIDTTYFHTQSPITAHLVSYLTSLFPIDRLLHLFYKHPCHDFYTSHLWTSTGETRTIYAYNMYGSQTLSKTTMLPSWKDA
jgi:hypothetical protein